MIKYFFLCLIILGISCAQNTNKTAQQNATLPGNDTVPMFRKVVSKMPVATYIIPMSIKKIDRKFGVEIFETEFTFKYLLVMYYDAMIQEDTLNIPDFGAEPIVKVRAGDEKLSCIIGFMDVRNQFREYKLLSGKNDKLKLSTIKNYGISTYYK